MQRRQKLPLVVLGASSHFSSSIFLYLQIERRIQAFMNRKQSEVDEANCREFCRVASSNTVEESCARTDSVFTPRDGSKSHVKGTVWEPWKGSHLACQTTVSGS